MTLDELKYPVLCLTQNLARVKLNADALTVCKKTALRKGGYYDHLLVVDSVGTALRVNGAEKLHGIGPFFGYNIFLNQTIRVRLKIEGSPGQVTLEEIKQRVFDSFKHWHGWTSRDDFEELKEAICNASSIAEVIQKLT